MRMCWVFKGSIPSNKKVTESKTPCLRGRSSLVIMANKIPGPGPRIATTYCVKKSQLFYSRAMDQVLFSSAVCRNYTPEPMNSSGSHFHLKMFPKIARHLLSGLVIYGRHVFENVSNLIFKKHKWRQFFWEYLITDLKETSPKKHIWIEGWRTYYHFRDDWQLIYILLHVLLVIPAMQCFQKARLRERF